MHFDGPFDAWRGEKGGAERLDYSLDGQVAAFQTHVFHLHPQIHHQGQQIVVATSRYTNSIELV